MTQPDQAQRQDPIQLQVLAAINAAAAVQTATSSATASAVRGLWRRVNPYDKRAVAEFARLAGQILVASQKTVATAHAASQQVQLRALGINRPILVTIPDNVRGSTITLGGAQPTVQAKKTVVDYVEPAAPKPAAEIDAPAERYEPSRAIRRPARKTPTAAVRERQRKAARTIPASDGAPDKLFERAAETYRYERSQGADHDAANAKAEQRIGSIVDNNMLLSARLAAQQTLVRIAEQDERLIGYRRIIHPELSDGGVCGLCIAAADRVYTVHKLQPIHDRCKCTIAPVTTAHDPGLALNEDDLGRLYAHSAETAPKEVIYGEVRRALPTSAKALKKTRYQIVDHGELGPVLTRVPGHPVPRASTGAPAA